MFIAQVRRQLSVSGLKKNDFQQHTAVISSHLSDNNTEGSQHGHTPVLDLGLAPPLDVAGRGAVGQLEGVENLRSTSTTTSIF